MVERVDDQHLSSSGSVEHLEDKQTDRASPEERHALHETGLGEIDGVDRDAEGLQHHRLERVESRRQGHDLRPWHPDLLSHRAIEGGRSDELDMRAQVRMAFTTPGAMPTRPVGVDCDEASARNIAILEVLAEIARELMAGHER